MKKTDNHQNFSQNVPAFQSKSLQAGKELTQEINTILKHEMACMDAEVKGLFQYKIILAVILHKTLKEFQHFSLEEIVNCMSEISKETEVSAGLTVSKETIDTLNTESVHHNEKRTYFDILFTVNVPSKPEHTAVIKLIIDLEVQQSLSLVYDIEARGIYYIARAISSQLNYVFENTKEYRDLKKVYSIWICLNDIPKSMQNTIVWHSFLPSRTYGIEPEKAPCKDLMEMIIIRLGNGKEKNIQSEILRFLYGIFEYSMHSEYFHEFISTQQLEKDEQLRKEIYKMGGAGQLFYNDVIKIGLQEGIEQGIEQGLEQARKEIKEAVKRLNSGDTEEDIMESGISPENIKAAKELIAILC